jgi:hypothetical protein
MLVIAMLPGRLNLLIRSLRVPWSQIHETGLKNFVALWSASNLTAGRRARLAQPVPALPGHALTGSGTGPHTQTQRGVSSVFSHLKLQSLLRTAQAIRASLLASAMASTLPPPLRS